MILEKKAQTAFAIHDLIALRWSPLAFDKNKQVSHEQLHSLLEAARWAPSCYGDEPWCYLVWDKNRDAAGWQKAFECLADGNKTWVKNAPVLMASVAGSLFAHNSKPNRWAQHDTGASSMSLVLQAVALGLVSHQMGGFDADKLRQIFGIPEGYTPMAMIAIGYQAEADILEGAIKEREGAPRARRPLREKFFEGSWGQPVV